MSSGRLCGLTPITFCRRISKLQVARGVALKKLLRGKHDFRSTTTSKNNVEKKKKNKEIKRTVSHNSLVVEEDTSSTPKSYNSIKHVSTSASPISAKKEPKTNILEGSPQKSTPNFILMVELRKNIFAFRDMIDLPSLDGSLSVTEIITQTMKDLQKLSPEIVTINQSFEMEGADMDKMLIFFYEDLRAIGDSWIMDTDWIYRSKYKNSGVGKNKSDRLVEHVLAALDGLIKTTRERFGMMDYESDGRKSFATPKGISSEPRRSFTRSASFSESNNSFYQSPFTPTSVLPGTMLTSSSSTSTSPSLWNLRAMALDKLSPVELKRFAMQILSQRDSDSVNEMNICIQEEEENEDNDSSVFETEKHDVKTEDHMVVSETEHVTDTEHMTETEYVSETEHDIKVLDSDHETESELKIKILDSDHEIEAENPIDDSETEHEIETQYQSHIDVSETEPEMETPYHTEAEDHSEATTSETNSIEDSVTPSPTPPAQSSSPTVSMLDKKPNLLTHPPPPPPSPQSETNTPTPPPPPPTSKACENVDFCSFPRSHSGNSPSMPAPPAPPGLGRSLRAKKATSKLRRSAQIANLYWVLKGKLEGRGTEGKTSKSSKGPKNVPVKSPDKSQRSGMADALAEMTKRSSYFQQIEEDVQKHAKSIEELKSSIHKFQTKDMKELLEFHTKVESVLEQLTDETQVLARFEGFPEKKLEVIRTAGALYKKLDGILSELKNWKIEPPLNDLLDKIERYFNKFKGEIETVERTKEEDAKMFQRYNINIDFEVLVQVKETMVDVSSNCMELALKERREANEEENNNDESKMSCVKAERAKRLWRAFQFAFKVYTFAGGHDERADCLTRQLAHEIQTDPDQID